MRSGLTVLAVIALGVAGCENPAPSPSPGEWLDDAGFTDAGVDPQQCQRDGGIPAQTCLGNGACCTVDAECCANVCRLPADGGTGTCVTEQLTGGKGAPCQDNADCVTGLRCIVADASLGRCEPI